MDILLACAVVATLVIVLAWRHEQRLRRRPRVLTEILDLADALEHELLECRARLREIAAMTAILPPAEQLTAQTRLAAEPQVQDALRDLLAHRLWLKEHAGTASFAELRSARDALATTRMALALQIERLAGVRADFEQTRAVRGVRFPGPKQ